MKAQRIIIIILILAVIAGAGFFIKGMPSGDSDDQNASTSTTAIATAEKQEPTKAADNQTADRKVLKLLIPKQKYQDVEKFVKKYNEEDNKYTIDLVHTETSKGIDPKQYDGLIIPGGKHVHPSFYGADVECDKHGFNPALDHLELNLVDEFVEAKKPILGLCRGCQLVNVALGGTLKQDIGMGHYHDAARATTIEKDTDFYKMFGDNVETLHYHHQAIDQLAPGLVQTMSDTEDGTIEGYVHTALPICAYQFHPDRMYVKEDPAIVDTGRIFVEYFFDLCQSEKTQ